MKSAPHTLISGMTDCGKSTMAKRLAAKYKKAGIRVYVLEPKGDPGFSADFQTPDPELFLQKVESSRDCLTIVDESGDPDICGTYAPAMVRIATQYRGLGHPAMFISQRPAQLNKTIRANCGNLFVFKQMGDDAETLAKFYGRREILDAMKFQQGEYLFIPAYGEPVRGNVFAGLKKKG
jgi:DNA helicase HerA-like ATPase